MRLIGQGTIAIDQSSIFTKLRGGDTGGTEGQSGHLILVPGVNHRFFTVGKVVSGRANGPAEGGFLDFATQRLCQNLMTKADADHGHVGGIGVAQERLQRSDPRQIVMGAVPRAGQ